MLLSCLLTQSFIFFSTLTTKILFCPVGAIEPLKCPLGYKEYDGSPRRTFSDTCEPCLPGSYGADPNRTSCSPCRAGVVCLAAATTDNPVSNSSSFASVLGVNATNSYLCPPGNTWLHNIQIKVNIKQRILLACFFSRFWGIWT